MKHNERARVAPLYLTFTHPFRTQRVMNKRSQAAAACNRLRRRPAAVAVVRLVLREKVAEEVVVERLVLRAGVAEEVEKAVGEVVVERPVLRKEVAEEAVVAPFRSFASLRCILPCGLFTAAACGRRPSFATSCAGRLSSPRYRSPRCRPQRCRPPRCRSP